MRFRGVLLRILRASILSILALVVLAFVFIHGQQYLLRHRAERLLADYKTLQLGHTSWPEMQAFIQRWQHWGYASQPCTSQYCSYNISVSDTISMHPLHPVRQGEIDISPPSKLLAYFGYRPGSIDATVTVVNDILLGDRIEVYMRAPSRDAEPFNWLAMSIRSQPNLVEEQHHKVDYETQMADHPDYFVGRPGGCEGCMIGWIHFTPHVSKEEYVRMTDFQLDCFTRRKACELPQDLLPMVDPYHLYDWVTRGDPFERKSLVCSVSPHTLGRDAFLVLVVDALSTKPHKLSEYEGGDGHTYGEYVKVSWVEALKGDVPPQVRAIKTFLPFPGSVEGDQIQGSEHLVPGKRYIVFWSDTGSEDAATMDRCGFVLDTSKNRELVLAGIAEDSAFESPKLGPQPLE